MESCDALTSFGISHFLLAQGFDALHACAPEESYEIFDAIIQVGTMFLWKVIVFNVIDRQSEGSV